jgi:hypothetical protein
VLASRPADTAEAPDLGPRHPHALAESDDADLAPGDQRGEVAPRDRQPCGRVDHAEQARKLGRGRPPKPRSVQIAPAPFRTVESVVVESAEFLNDFAGAGDET